MIVTPWDGKMITRPGIYSGVPMWAYHEPLINPKLGHSVSRSRLWTFFNKSAAHCWDESPYNPDRNPDAGKESDPLRFGRAAHHLLLGEDDFLDHFVIRPEKYPDGAVYPSEAGAMKPWSGNSTWCKAWLADNTDRTLILTSELERIRGMANGLMANPLVRAGILNGLVEHTIVVQDPDSGLWIKIRPDVMPNDSGDFGDLKSAADVSDESLEESIGRDGLFMQGGMTAWACRLLPEPIELQSFNLIFSEKTRPFCSRVRALKPHELDFGETCARAAAKAYVRCVERSVWPGPGGEETDASYIEMRPFTRARLEQKLKLMETTI